jgi:hypothetical protein
MAATGARSIPDRWLSCMPCACAIPRLDGIEMSAWPTSPGEILQLFAWPWWLLALPLPWLVQRWLPAARSPSAALKVPFGGRLDAIAGAGGFAGRRCSSTVISRRTRNAVESGNPASRSCSAQRMSPVLRQFASHR